MIYRTCILKTNTNKKTTMKRILYFLFLLPLGMSAQNMYDVAPFFGNDLVGTARFIGMGGSMSALGADLSTMGTNPAGMAMYRSNDFSFTAALDVNSNKALYEGSKSSMVGANAYVGNTSFVISSEYEDSDLKFLNFGFGYRRKNNLSGAFDMYGASNSYSQQYVFENLYNSKPFDYLNIKSSMYDTFSYSWLPLFAADAGLYDETGENFITYPDTALVWHPDELAFYEETRGGVHAIDFNLSANLNDRVYLGATMSVSVVDYNRYSEYREIGSNNDIYILENNQYLSGTGFDIKLGAIFRPFKYSPFKVGLALHTPTWYSLNQRSSASILGPSGIRYSTTDKELYDGVLSVSSTLKTPWRVNASMGYTFGTYLALNAEYEYVNYAKNRFIGNGQLVKAQNEEIGCNMQAQHTVRVGAEVNISGFAVRAGYNYITAPFVQGAYKELYNAAVTETSTDYMNRFGKNVATFGFGYRGSLCYWDFAYKLDIQKSEFYPFYDYDFVNPGAAVREMNHSIVATVGLRL